MHPWNAMTTRVDLKSPEFGDQQEAIGAVHLWQTMDGAIRTCVKTSPVTLDLEFRDVPREKAIEFRDFLVASLGQKVRYVDYEGVQWVGFIKTEPDQVTDGLGFGNVPRPEGCSFKVEFEGTKL